VLVVKKSSFETNTAVMEEIKFTTSLLTEGPKKNLGPIQRN